MLRRLLVSSAHYILGPFGSDSDLRYRDLSFGGCPHPTVLLPWAQTLQREAGARRRQMSQQRDVGVGQGAVRVSERRSVIAAGAVAGIVGLILFTVTFFVQGLFRLEEYDPVAEVVSALEAGPGG